MKRSIKLAVLTTVFSLFASTSIFATTVATTNNNNVTASVAGGCRWDTPLTIAFGAYDPWAGTALTQNATVAFRCVKKTNATDTYKVWFSKTGGNMLSGTDTLAYTLTDGTNPLPTVAPGATPAGTPGVGAGMGYTYAVVGVVTANQDAAAGNYQDTVVVNIEY
jgi:spore coat protein U-like protein